MVFFYILFYFKVNIVAFEIFEFSMYLKLTGVLFWFIIRDVVTSQVVLSRVIDNYCRDCVWVEVL